MDVELINRCGSAAKKIAILKQLQTHFKAKLQKGVGTPFPRVPAPLHPAVTQPGAHPHKQVKSQ